VLKTAVTQCVDLVIEQLGPRVWAPKDPEELSAICYRAVATRGDGFSITAPMASRCRQLRRTMPETRVRSPSPAC
jgi:hypothetical protein